MSIDTVTITLVTAVSALVAGVVGPLVSVSIAREQIRATVVSNSRERWLEALRDSIADYLSLATSMYLAEHGELHQVDDMARKDKAFRRKAEQMIRVRSRIFLMTNPQEEAHRALCERIETAHTTLLTAPQLALQDWRSLLDAVTQAARTVLKTEWNRVKRGD